MPEGPEIRRAADELARALVGRVAETAGGLVLIGIGVKALVTSF